MNLYVETNFVLELALLQEQAASCEEILRICEAGSARLLLPGYSIPEAYETLTRRHKSRRRLKEELDQEMSQLSRTVDYAAKLDGYRELTSLLTDTAGEEVRRLEEVRSRLPGTAAILPLDGPTLGAASEYQRKHALDPRDALVYASVALHLEADGEASCFLTRDAKDFGDPGLIAELAQWGCKVLHRFETGLGFVRGQLGADEHA